MTQAHTVTLRPNTHRQSQKSAQSTLAVDAMDEDNHEPSDDSDTGVANEHLVSFDDDGWEDDTGDQTEDGPKRPAVRVLF